MIFVSATASQQLPGWVSVPPIITSLSFDAISGARVIAASTSVNGPVASTVTSRPNSRTCSIRYSIPSAASTEHLLLPPLARAIGIADGDGPPTESGSHENKHPTPDEHEYPRQIPANRNNLIGHIHRHIITRHTSSISQSPGPCQPSIPQSIITWNWAHPASGINASAQEGCSDPKNTGISARPNKSSTAQVLA